MSGKASPEHSKNKRKSLRLYASRVFKESYVSVLLSAVNTSSLGRRIFKVITFLLCYFGFLYQTGVFLSAVLKYPTSMETILSRPDSYSIPAYTFCNNNGINKRIFCEKFPDKCEIPSEAFCEKYKHYCGENGTLVPQAKYFNYQNDIEEKELFELNEKLNDFVVEFQQFMFGTTWASITGPYVRHKAFDHYKRFRCYCVNDRVSNGLDPPVHTYFQTLSRAPVHRLRFRVREDEMFQPGVRPGVIFALHSPFEAVNPFETGIFMKPGRKYLVSVNMEEEILLKSPYDTDCTNYTEVWERNGRRGRRSQEMCKHDCISDILVQCFNCVAPASLYPRPERFCELGFEWKFHLCSSEFPSLHEQCMNTKCKEDCRRVKYSFNVQERFEKHFDNDGNPQEGEDDHIQVEIYRERDEIVQFQHSPKFMFVEVFSNVGGFIGCWLGISLLDITDVFEGLFRVFRYAFKMR